MMQASFMASYLDYYLSNLEGYLLGEVRTNFVQRGYLSSVEFFCIVIWKANRAKSKIARKLLKEAGCGHLEEAVRTLTLDISKAGTREQRMSVMIEKWKFGLPMASAVLTILYPEEFTIYDVRVAQAIDEANKTAFVRLGQRTAFKSLWSGYSDYVECVNQLAPVTLCLRDKDRWLWGQSFLLQLQKDIQENFSSLHFDRD